MMERPDSHRKLTRLLSVALTACTSAALLAGCGGALLPQNNARAASRFATYDQVVDAFEQIRPGVTRDADLPNIGFDATTGNVDVLSYLDIETRFMPNAAVRFEQLDPSVQDCIRARNWCTGYVFHPALTASKRVGDTTLDLLGFDRVTRSEHWAAEIILLVENGRVVHKVFSGTPRTENWEDKKQPLGPLQDLGGALAHAAGSYTSY